MRLDSSAKERLELFWVFLWGACLLLAGRLFQIQVLQHGEHLKAAERNRTQLIFTAAPRGRIMDRQGRLLAGSQAAFSLVYLPGGKLPVEEVDALAAALAPHLREKKEKVAETLKRSAKKGIPVRLAQGLSREAMFRLSELKTLYPGITLVVEAQRRYPFGPSASHLLGFLGDIDPAAWAKLREEGLPRMDTKVGRAGLERVLEQDLRGLDGGIQLEVDAQGRLQRLLRKIDSRPGRDVTLTLDATVQQAAEEALRQAPGGAGAVVALDPWNGEVVALASVPDFDPNAFVGLPTEGEEGPRKTPEFSFAVQGTFPPGSVFKIVTSAAAFENRKFDPRKTVLCTGEFKLGDRVFKCHKKEGHGERDYWSGLADSCDTYFYNMGLATGGSLIEKTAADFGIGELTKIPLRGEAKGQNFGPRARAGKRPGWRQGDTVNLSIGQGGLLVTPLQQAVLLAAVATRGDIYRPRVVAKVSEAGGAAVYETYPEKVRRVELSERTWKLLEEGLKRVVDDGTGRGAQIEGLDVRGKTGTSQNPHGEDHAWFAAYAAKEGGKPELVVAVLVDKGGHGSVAAVPVARRVLKAWFERGTGGPI